MKNYIKSYFANLKAKLSAYLSNLKANKVDKNHCDKQLKGD